MTKRRANGEGSIRKRPDGRWEGRYTVKCTHKTGQMKQCQTQRMDRRKNAEPKHWTKSCAISGELWYYDFNFQEVCIMAAKKPFAESEQKLLKRNPYTYQVTAQEIHFTAEFKQAFWDLYRSGISPVLVMRQLGYDTDLLGKERIRGIRTAVQRQALSPEGFRNGVFKKAYQLGRREQAEEVIMGIPSQAASFKSFKRVYHRRAIFSLSATYTRLRECPDPDTIIGFIRSLMRTGFAATTRGPGGYKVFH